MSAKAILFSRAKDAFEKLFTPETLANLNIERGLELMTQFFTLSPISDAVDKGDLMMFHYAYPLEELLTTCEVAITRDIGKMDKGLKHTQLTLIFEFEKQPSMADVGLEQDYACDERDKVAQFTASVRESNVFKMFNSIEPFSVFIDIVED